MTGPEYLRPDMAQAPGARAEGPELELHGPSEVERAAATPGGEARRGDVVFWDRVAQSHKRIGRQR